MHRYMGAGFSSPPKIALIANDSLGNYVMSTLVSQMVRAELPGSHLTLMTGTRVSEFTAGNPLYDDVVEIYSSESLDTLKSNAGRSFDWVINLERSPLAMVTAALLAGSKGAVTGPCLSADGRGEFAFEPTPEGELQSDKDWVGKDITRRHPILTTGFIGEIFCRTAYLRGPIPGYSIAQVDPGKVPDVLIATAASLPDKLWPTGNWIELVNALASDGLTVGLLGAKPAEQAQFWKGADAESELVASTSVVDLRGELTLPQVAGAIARARFVVTLDNGILHLACSTDTPVFGLFRNGIHRLWAPPVPNLCVIEPGESLPVRVISVESVIKEIKNFQIPLAQF